VAGKRGICNGKHRSDEGRVVGTNVESLQVSLERREQNGGINMSCWWRRGRLSQRGPMQ